MIMRQDLKNALEGVIEEWHKSSQKFKEIINRTDLTGDQIIALFKIAVSEASVDALVALKLAHCLLLD